MYWKEKQLVSGRIPRAIHSPGPAVGALVSRQFRRPSPEAAGAVKTRGKLAPFATTASTIVLVSEAAVRMCAAFARRP